MQKRTRALLLTIAGIFFITNCDSKAIYSTYKTYPNHWHKDSIATFNFTAPDTLNTYNLYINLRVNNDYEYNNLYVIATLNYPNGKIEKDTLEYKITAPNGELLGIGFSDVKEQKLWYKGYNEPFMFSETGNYAVNIEHAMRKNGIIDGVKQLKGITEVGLSVEHTLK